jgi:hypothetical protein
MPRAYRITVWFVPREFLLEARLPPAQMTVVRPPAPVWEFIARAPPPPRDGHPLWWVVYALPEGGEREVCLDMRFVRKAVPARAG